MIAKQVVIKLNILENKQPWHKFNGKKNPHSAQCIRATTRDPN